MAHCFMTNIHLAEESINSLLIRSSRSPWRPSCPSHHIFPNCFREGLDEFLLTGWIKLQWVIYWFSSHTVCRGRLRGLTVARWITDHCHPGSNLGVGISEGCFIFDFDSLPLKVAQHKSGRKTSLSCIFHHLISYFRNRFWILNVFLNYFQMFNFTLIYNLHSLVYSWKVNVRVVQTIVHCTVNVQLQGSYFGIVFVCPMLRDVWLQFPGGSHGTVVWLLLCCKSPYFWFESNSYLC